MKLPLIVASIGDLHAGARWETLRSCLIESIMCKTNKSPKSTLPEEEGKFDKLHWQKGVVHQMSTLLISHFSKRVEHI